jgi:hypothetical protein
MSEAGGAKKQKNIATIKNKDKRHPSKTSTAKTKVC